jgi:hypothetical protein
VEYLFQLKQPVLAYNGSNLSGVFYIDDQAKRTAENLYTIPCCDAIGVLDGYDFEAVIYSGKTRRSALVRTSWTARLSRNRQLVRVGLL